MTKICSRCKTSKNHSDFAKKTGKLLQAYCRPCQKLYQAEYFRREDYHAKQLDRVRERNKRVRKEAQDFLWQHKNKPCTDCKVQYPPYVMDFDHLDSSQKSFGIAKGQSHRSREELLAEMAKCEVVCSNCHRIRTYSRRHAGIV